MIFTAARSDVYLPLTEVGVPAAALERLAALGIIMLEELRDFWTYGDRQLLMDYLSDSPIRFVSYTPPADQTRSAAAVSRGGSVNLLAAGRTPPLVKHARGVALTSPQRRSTAVTPEPVPVTRRRGVDKAVSLAKSFPPVRDQAQRGTCVAFASVACLEYHLYNASPKTQHHSEQFVYWACKEIDKIANKEGTYVRIAHRVLKTRGACLAKTWSYEPLPISAHEGQGPPPDGAEAEAKKYTWSSIRKVAATNVEQLRECIDQKKPVVLSVKTFPSWDYPSVEDTGEIPMPLPGTHPDGGHAVCVVGYELHEGSPGGGAFIFRNSWGRQWARRAGRFGEGFGTLYFEYIHQYGLEAFC